MRPVLLTRRHVLRGLAVTTLAPPGAAGAQPSGKLPRVGYVQNEAAATTPLRAAFFEGLRARGWLAGQNVVIDWKRGDDEIPALVRSSPDVMVLPNPYRLQAGLRLTKTIPIVTIDLESDPVAKGFLKSLARPGGNLTGIWMDIPEIAGKQLQLLREAVPGLRRVAVVWDDRVAGLQFTATEAAGRTMDVAVQGAPVRDESEIAEVVNRVLPARPQAILILTSPVSLRAQSQLAKLAVQHRLPTISGFSTFPDDGGLMAFGPNFPAMFRQLANYVDRILRGAKAGDLPIERPTKFELRINARTARALRLTLPPSLLARADEVIE